MHTLVSLLLRDESGATAIEYGLIGGLIAVVIITTVAIVGADLQGLYTDIAAEIAAAR